MFFVMWSRSDQSSKAWRRWLGNRWAPVLCLVAVILQTGLGTFLAHGTYQSQEGDGRSVLDICTGFGIQRIVLGDSAPERDQNHAPSVFCPICPLAGSEAAEPAPTIERPFAYHTVIAPTNQRVRPLADVACATPLPARGPPLL